MEAFYKTDLVHVHEGGCYENRVRMRKLKKEKTPVVAEKPVPPYPAVEKRVNIRKPQLPEKRVNIRKPQLPVEVPVVHLPEDQEIAQRWASLARQHADLARLLSYYAP